MVLLCQKTTDSEIPTLHTASEINADAPVPNPSITKLLNPLNLRPRRPDNAVVHHPSRTPLTSVNTPAAVNGSLANECPKSAAKQAHDSRLHPSTDRNRSGGQSTFAIA